MLRQSVAGHRLLIVGLAAAEAKQAAPLRLLDGPGFSERLESKDFQYIMQCFGADEY